MIAQSRLTLFARGVKVLDLSQYLPGPLTTLLLADMGAQVLKIEPPTGDGMQELGPRGASGEPIFYRTMNAGKSVCRLNLKSEAGREDFRRLVRDADVVVEGFRPGVMSRLGLDYQRLRELNPGLVYCSINGWGSSGRQSGVAGHDGNYLAAAGVLHRNGGEDPDYFDPPVADTSGSLFAVIAIVGALNARRLDGNGCHIDLALADMAMPLQLLHIAAFGADGTVPQPNGTYLNGGAAFYRVYRTRDGRHVMLGAVERKFWTAFCQAADRPEWIERHEEPTPQRDLTEDLNVFFAGLSLADCMHRFDGVDCCLTPVLDLGEALSSPYHLERRIVRTSPEGDLQALFPAFVDGIAPPDRRPLRDLAEGGFDTHTTAPKLGSSRLDG